MSKVKILESMDSEVLEKMINDFIADVILVSIKMNVCPVITAYSKEGIPKQTKFMHSATIVYMDKVYKEEEQ